MPGTPPTVLRTEIAYDGLGRPVGRSPSEGGWVGMTERTNSEPGVSRTFVWCGRQLCEERDAGGAAVTKRFYPGGEQIDGTAYYFNKDHLGTVWQLVWPGGAARERYDYDPYGRRTVILAGSQSADFGFTGHYYHKPSGLHFAVYRAYDAEIGRWLNRDPIGENGGINLYGFVGNNPVNGIDQLGLAFGDWWDWRTYSPAYARLKGMNDLDAFAKSHGYRGYEDMYTSLHDDDPYAYQRMQRENIQAAADIASEAANDYLTAATAVTPTGVGAKCVTGLGRRAPEFLGGRLSESGFLNAAEKYLGKGYTEVSPGRFVSADGLRQLRFGAHEVRGPQLHGHFEVYDAPGGHVIENTRVDIDPD